jgi:hypothetical protein
MRREAKIGRNTQIILLLAGYRKLRQPFQRKNKTLH